MTSSDERGEPAPQSGFNVDEVFAPRINRSLRRMPILMRAALRLVRQAAPRVFLVAAVLQMVGGIGITAQLLVGRRLLEHVLAPAEEFTRVVPVLVGFAVVTTLVQFTVRARAEQQLILSELVGRYAVGQVVEVAAAVDLRAYETPGFHDRLQRALTNALVRPVQMAQGMLGLVSGLFAVAGIGGALLVIEPLFLVLVMVAYVPTWLATTRASKVFHRFNTEQTQRERRRNYLLTVLTGKDEAKEIRSFNLARFLRERHDDLYDLRVADLRQVVRRRLRLGVFGSLATSALTAGTVAVLLYFVTVGRMDLAAAGTAAGAVVLLGQRLQVMAGSAASLYESSLFLEDFTTFVDAMPAIQANRPSASPPPNFDVLQVDEVSFTYPSRSEPALKGVSIEVRRGEVVALVGENGSGKTTLAKLLAGLHDPDEGSIMWDRVDTRTYDATALRQSVAVIFQDFIRYHLTAGENIGMGRWERYDDKAAIAQAAVRAGAHPFLDSLPNGYDTNLAPHFLGGVDLSVGQWQRVALARAFFRDAPFIILDEPTSALDPRAESRLFEDLRQLLQGRTALLISHRFSSVRSADRIYVMQDGGVVEHGTHGELMANGGLYADLFSLQAAAYLDSKP